MDIPPPESARRRPATTNIGAALWLLAGTMLVAQVIAAAAWSDPAYSWTAHAISDLGVTTCGEFSDGGQVRAVCSPAHLVFNLGLVVGGLLVAAGAVLLRSVWGTTATRVAMIFMLLSGLCVATVGLLPWDLEPDLHDLAALAQWVFQVVAMLLLVSLVRDPRPGSALLATGTLGCVIISVVGFVVFLVGFDADTFIGWGLAERLAFDVLTLWTMAVGAHILIRKPGPADEVSPPTAART